ncbi:MAG: tandem-95 repeat protein, partial [candidate division Zixibacteria bacterium]|nr:tandem-95 repeat protein [candidate division Zixibacteria bacterium]
QSGSYNVTFYATDDSTAVDSEVVTITVIDGGNQLPILATIGAQSTTENVLLSFGVTATDIESIPTLTTSTLPIGAVFTDNGNGTGSFDWTPTFLQSGSYNVTFYATDDSTAVDSEVVTITVNDFNQPPVLAAIGSKSVDENVSLNFGISATDADATTPTLSTSTLPTGATFVDNLNGTGTFDWSPDFTQAGIYNVTFYATDGIATDSEIVAITVNDVNQAPVLNPIGPKSVNEAVNLNFTVTATDGDGTTPSLSTSGLPSGATFVDNGNGTGTFDWTPDFTQSAVYNVTFVASDGVLNDFEDVQITVNEAGNQVPVLDPIGAQIVDEGINLSFGVSANDADGTIPTLTTSTLPTGATFVDNANGTGSFDWTPDFTQSGAYNVTFYASDGIATDSEVVSITVNNINQPPVLATIGAKSVAELSNLNFGVTSTDPDGTTPSLTTSALPTGATFTDNLNGTGTFDWTPGLGDAGNYSVTFFAGDGALQDSEVVAIAVTTSGGASEPLFVNSSVSSLTITSEINSHGSADGLEASITSNRMANDGHTWTFDFENTLNSGAALLGAEIYLTHRQTGFSNDSLVFEYFDGTSFVEFESFANVPTALTQIGPFTASNITTISQVDGFQVRMRGVLKAGGHDAITYFVDALELRLSLDIPVVNNPPILSAIGAQSVNESVNLNFGVSATDADLTTPSLNTSALPTGASFVDNFNGTGTFDWTPDFAQSGVYNITFYATDGIDTDSEQVTITVNNVNQPVVLAPIGAKAVDENVSLSFGISASDADGTTPSLSSSTLPTGASFVDNGNGTGSFGWTPDFTQAGVYNVTFYATDGIATDSEIVAITVTDVNQPPILAAIGSKTTDVLVNLNFGVSASDPDGATPSLTTSTLPTGATFVDNGNGTGTFDWTPAANQDSIYNITFFASDGSLVDFENVQITVNPSANNPPVLAAIGAQSVNENTNLNFGVSATDADATIPALSTSALPTGAAFVDNGNGTGTFDWTPDFLQSGNYNVTFYATDGFATDSEIVVITVNDGGNQLPVLAAIGAQSTTENVLLSFGVSATDPESTPVLTTSTLPAGAIFTDSGNGTGSFDWIPDFFQSGTYNVTFYATDDSSAIDSEIVTITVNDAGNQTPILATIGAQSTTENVLLSFGVSATDAESAFPVLTTSTLPSGAVFTDNGNGTGSFDWTPDFLQSGSFNVTFYATDDSTAVDSEVVTITVTDAGNQLPVLTAIGAQSTTENVLLTFGVSATDIESTPVLTTSALPSGALFTDNGNGTGSFDWTPGSNQGGSYNITFYATDDSTAVDSEIVAITVNFVNDAPVLTAIGAKATTENVNLNFGVTASDPDGTIPVLTTNLLPSGASFTDNGNGSGSFDWTPTYFQSGVYNITFYATDDSSAVDSEIVTITVTEAGNQNPVLSSIGSKIVTEDVLLSFGVSASDADGPVPSLTTSALPTGAVFTDNGNGTGLFDWTPDFAQSGIYNITFYATDDSAAVDSEAITITVSDAGNQLPVLESIGAQSTTENVQLTFGLTSSDPDGPPPALTAFPLPGGATFIDSGNGNGSFDWTPDFLQSGSYDVTFYVTDSSFGIDSEVVTITVIDAGNQLPILSAIGAQSTTENLLLNFGVTASDIESTPVLTTSTLPSGAVFTDNGNGTGSFDWTPDFLQSGTYNVTFYATDDSTAVDSEIVTITVNDAGNQLPILTAIGAQSTTENVLLSFGVSASDIESIPTLTTSTLPTGAVFTDNGNGTGSFDWTPDFLQSGTYNVTFYATDDSSAIDSEIVTITVNDAGNQLPILSAIGAQSTTENILLSFGVSAADIESTPVLTTSALPTGAVFTDNGNGTGSFDWTPDFLQSGSYNITFYAT